MRKQIPAPLFYGIVAVVFAVVVVLLYREATDPLYHRHPDDQRFIPPGVRQQMMAERMAGGAARGGAPNPASPHKNQAPAQGSGRP